jgi:hypothetical protein
MNTVKHLVFLVLVVFVIRSAPARPETRMWQSQAVAIITFGYIATIAVGQRRAPRRPVVKHPQDHAMDLARIQRRDPLGWLASHPWRGGDL